MTACEQCWTEASRRALILGGHVADHYRDLLADNPDGHEPQEQQP